MSFAATLAGVEPREGGFALTVPDDWHQGRTAYGGFSTALALSAARQQCGAGLPPLRSAAISFIGPLFGPVEIRARKLRQGKNATWASAEILRDGAVGLSASFVFMRPVPSALHLNDCPAPADAVPPEDAVVVEPAPHSPSFFKEHIDMRYATPRSLEKRPEVCRWVRLMEREGLDAVTELLLVADVAPPAVLPMLDSRAPASSMLWQANLLTDNPETRDGWWLLRSRASYAANGCSSQIMEVWNAMGEPVMTGMQSMAVFG